MKCSECGAEKKVVFKGGDIVVVQGSNVGPCLVLSAQFKNAAEIITVVGLKDGISRNYWSAYLVIVHGHIHIDRSSR